VSEIRYARTSAGLSRAYRGRQIDRFADRGTHPLEGVPGEWHLYAVDGA
jgi:hypothetical protein